MEYGRFEFETLGNVKKVYVKIIDNKLRLLDMYKYTLADKNIHLHTCKLQTSTDMLKTK